MISVAKAERIILNEVRDYGSELIPFERAMGRVLAEDMIADRDVPACDKATMDGIAIDYEAFAGGVRAFTIKGVVAAGDAPVDTDNADECVEIMTGAPVPGTLNTVVRYEDLEINNGTATVNTGDIKRGQNIHRQGKDKQAGAVMMAANETIDATTISVAASLGLTDIKVKRAPRRVIITTGDELVNIDQEPTRYQLRSSNNHTLKAILADYGVNSDLLHIADEPGATKQAIADCLTRYELIILTGGVSMGKYDYVPRALEEAGVNKLFHKVAQKPGKPFWFGKHDSGALIFAFPGNPVSTFMCAHRYLLPWMKACLDGKAGTTKTFAALGEDVSFSAPLEYFMQVYVSVDESGRLIATPSRGNGSGDFANLAASNAFMELPAERDVFHKGEVYKIWPFKTIL